jgi:hypothetical protein
MIPYRDEAFEFDGRRVLLVQRMRGIRVVKGLVALLSILTSTWLGHGTGPTRRQSKPADL